MKTLAVTKKILSGIAYFSVTTLFLFAMVNCGDDGGSGGRAGPRPNPGPTNCDGCKANQTNVLATALGETTPGTNSDVQLALGFFSQDGAAQTNNGGWTYSGPVVAEGDLYVDSVTAGYGDDCNIRQGHYRIKAHPDFGPGDMSSNGTISYLPMLGEGPDRIHLEAEYFTTISVTPQLVSCHNQLFAQKLSGKIRVKAVNERVCNNTFIYVHGLQNFNCN